MFTRSFLFAWMGAVLLPGCYAASSSSIDAGSDAGRAAVPVDAAVDAAVGAVADEDAATVDAPVVEGPGVVSLMRSAPSEETCPEWDVPAHPSPEVPEGTPDGAQPLWQHSDPLDGYIGNIGLAPDGSIRVLGPRATTFLRINRDGTVAWSRNVGRETYTWAIAPDGSIFGAGNVGGEWGHRLIHLGPDGTMVGTYEFDVSTPGIYDITFGPLGRVYVSKGSLVALCRTDRIDWEMTASLATGLEVGFGGGVVDGEGMLITGVAGTTRAARISGEGILLEWMGSDRPVGLYPERAAAVITSVFGTRAILYSIVNFEWMEESTIAAPGQPPINRTLARHFDGLGRLISMDGTRETGWLWEQGDGSVVHTTQLCDSVKPVFLDDGGVLCTGYAAGGAIALRRLSPEGSVIWERVLPEVASGDLNLDVDGRLTYVTWNGTSSVVRSAQTNVRPARGHWGEVNGTMRYTR